MERVPKVEYVANDNQQQQPLQVLNSQLLPQAVPMPSAKDEEKMPLFLIKLWNIVEDPSYQNIIRWDDSGYSFHIVDPYSFCRNVLPHYFKHNNLNSLIRQLNMYGFRKVSPLDKGGLTRSESDQDHLEFSHTCFIRGRPDLMVNIKRRQSNRTADNSAIAVQTHNNLQMITEELRQLREKQRNMDNKMHDLTKENETLWEQLDHVRQQHNRQQQVVTKLVQFLVAMVQPNLSKRVLKRGVLAIDEPPPNKRPRTAGASSSSTNLTEILDRLQRELTDNGGFQQQQNYQREERGPIIADVTDEFGQFVSSPTSKNSNNYSDVPSPSNSDQQPARVFPQKSQYAVPPQNYQPALQPLPAKKKVVQTLVPQAVQPSSSSQVVAPIQTPSPLLTLSPALERQISAELQEYLNGVDMNIDNCRDLLNGNWDMDFLEQLEDETEKQTTSGPQLALEQAPPSYANLHSPEVGANEDVLAHQVEDGFVADPGTPQLLTPCTSPTYP